uniref:Secreted protein n=1 Tax=Oryza glumipatula TaxID=40148 RepID=A0A0E0AV85_9ORYZ
MGPTCQCHIFLFSFFLVFPSFSPWRCAVTGGDVFSVPVLLPLVEYAERTTRDGVSVNFNAPQFIGDGGEEVTFVLERGGAAGLFLCRPGSEWVEPHPAVEETCSMTAPRQRQGVWAHRATASSPSRPIAAPPLGPATATPIKAGAMPRVRRSNHRFASRPRCRFALAHVIAPLQEICICAILKN